MAYDHVFAEDMRVKYPNYPALEAASKKKKSTTKTSTSGKAKKATGRKTISVSSETQSDEDSSDSDEEYAGSGDDFVGPPPFKIRRYTLTRGLRSRLAT